MIKHKGRYIVYNDKKEIICDIENQVTNLALSEFIKVLNGQATDFIIKKLKLGDNDSPVSPVDTDLKSIKVTVDFSERKLNGKQLITTFNVTPNSTFQAKEIGIFCGTTGTKMLSRQLVSFTAEQGKTYTIQRIDEFI